MVLRCAFSAVESSAVEQPWSYDAAPTAVEAFARAVVESAVGLLPSAGVHAGNRNCSRPSMAVAFWQSLSFVHSRLLLVAPKNCGFVVSAGEMQNGAMAFRWLSIALLLSCPVDH